jgi:hypothetical protein
MNEPYRQKSREELDAANSFLGKRRRASRSGVPFPPGLRGHANPFDIRRHAHAKPLGMAPKRAGRRRRRPQSQFVPNHSIACICGNTLP